MANVAIGASIPVNSGAVGSVRSEAMMLLKRLASILGVLLVLIVVSMQKDKLLALIDHPLERVKVSGAFDNLNESRVNQVLSSFVGQGFFSVDLDLVKQAAESLPWVESATVSRVWPGQLSVYLSEQVPLAKWNDTALLNASGLTFKPETISEKLGALPLLYGSEVFSDKKKAQMIAMYALLEEKLSVYGLGLKSVELNLRNAWELTLMNGISVAIGALDSSNYEGMERLSAKLERVGKVFSSHAGIDVSKVARIDARYPNGVAIKWHKIK